MRLTVAGGMILLVVALAAFASGAEDPTVHVSTPPATVTADRPWPAEVSISRNGRPLSLMHPELVIRRGRQKHSFVARPSGPDGSYRVNVTFPGYGAWTYGVQIGADFVDAGTVRVHSGPALRSAVTPGGP